MKRSTLILFTVLLASCLPEPNRECLGSNECTDDRVCRAGMCVLLSSARADSEADARVGHTTQPDTGEAAGEADATAAADTTDADTHLSDAEDIVESPCPGAGMPGAGDLRINEVLANPPPGELGDANRDGTRDAFEDEFVELVNMTAGVLDLTDTRLFISGKAKVLFDDTCLPPGESIVVFGGFRGQGLPIAARGSTTVVSSSRLGLSNSGGSVSVARSNGTTIDSVTYSDAPPESLTRAPQLHGQDFIGHSALPGARLMSPGQCADGAIITTGCPNSEPTGDAGTDADIDPGADAG
ncbi:MAG: lamin tail domain-containing protein [Myxococcota bacterium]